MTLTTVLVILLVLFLIGALPVYPYSRNWGYYPSGILAFVVAVVALMLMHVGVAAAAVPAYRRFTPPRS